MNTTMFNESERRRTLVHWLKNTRLSRAEIALVLGVHHWVLYLWERGFNVLSPATVDRLEAFLTDCEASRAAILSQPFLDRAAHHETFKLPGLVGGDKLKTLGKPLMSRAELTENAFESDPDIKERKKWD